MSSCSCRKGGRCLVCIDRDGLTFGEQLDELEEKRLDLAYAILKALGIVAFVKRFGGELKPWRGAG